MSHQALHPEADSLWDLFSFLVEIGSLYVVAWNSWKFSCLSLPRSGINGMPHHPNVFFFLFFPHEAPFDFLTLASLELTLQARQTLSLNCFYLNLQGTFHSSSSPLLPSFPAFLLPSIPLESPLLSLSLSCLPTLSTSNIEHDGMSALLLANQV